MYLRGKGEIRVERQVILDQFGGGKKAIAPYRAFVEGAVRDKSGGGSSRFSSRFSSGMKSLSRR